ncbi:NAD(P)-dependent oxidoreductase [Leucothrix sargassi]|nr:NAD(P)-dependent oxidoreductase [Leucothrix sargassi]
MTQSLAKEFLNLAETTTGKLDADTIRGNFTEMAEPLTQNQAIIEADRCYFCYDAPCMTACPTGINVPEFIRRIKTGNTHGAAEKILEENIMGAMCSRVCPTEELCEQVCVRNDHEEMPVKIGLLQRFATETTINDNVQYFKPDASTGKHIAVVGAGPAGLSCAHGLARKGHKVTIFEKRQKAGGLNEFGIATYKALNDIAQKEVDYILEIGNIDVQYGQALGTDFTLASLENDYDAVFVGVGLGDVNPLRLENESTTGVSDAVRYIETLRQLDDASEMPIADKIIVIGGGMTAVDIAVQSKKLGASEVTIVYRRDQSQMGASEHEQEYAQINNVKLMYSLSPSALKVENDQVTGIRFQETQTNSDGTLTQLDSYKELPADIVFKAIGQKLVANDLAGSEIVMEKGRISVDEQGKTSAESIWAGGDCVAGGNDLTVSAVQDGKVAAQSIHAYLQS